MGIPKIVDFEQMMILSSKIRLVYILKPVKLRYSCVRFLYSRTYLSDFRNRGLTYLPVRDQPWKSSSWLGDHSFSFYSKFFSLWYVHRDNIKFKIMAGQCYPFLIKKEHWCRFSLFIINFEHISHLFLVFLLLTLDNKMLACFAL